jgi:hypothetical protein
MARDERGEPQSSNWGRAVEDIPRRICMRRKRRRDKQQGEMERRRYKRDRE